MSNNRTARGTARQDGNGGNMAAALVDAGVSTETAEPLTAAELAELDRENAEASEKARIAEILSGIIPATPRYRDWLGFGLIKLAMPENPKPYVDAKTGAGSRPFCAGKVALNERGTNFLKFTVSLRWEANAESKGKPHLSFPTLGRFTAALETSDNDTLAAFERWKREATAAAILFVQTTIAEQSKRARAAGDSNAAIVIAPEIVVDATSLGFSIK